MEDIGWRSLEQASRLKLVDVTTFVLEEAVRRRRSRVATGSEPAPRVSYRGDSVRIIRRSG